MQQKVLPKELLVYWQVCPSYKESVLDVEKPVRRFAPKELKLAVYERPYQVAKLLLQLRLRQEKLGRVARALAVAQVPRVLALP